MSYIEAIKKRISVRTYSDEPIADETLKKVEEIISVSNNPFGADVRFSLLKKDNTEGKLGTYGFIKGPKVFIAGCMKESEKDLEGYGYAFEKVILELTKIGLSTCWLGGTFSRGGFAKSVQLQDNEILPCVTPIGYTGKKKSLMGRIAGVGAGARKRIPFEQLFFDGGFYEPLELGDGALKTCLEMVRQAPSASNKQPWRVLKQDNSLHFYLAKTKNYSGNSAFGFCMQRIDLGIAACHFELAAKENGLKGNITVNDPGINTDFEYSFTWTGVQ